MLQGIGVSTGIAIAKAYLVKKAEIVYEEKTRLTPSEERKRFEDARVDFMASTEKLAESVRQNASEKEAAILEAHIMMASDPEIIGAIETAIDSEGLTAESAVNSQFTMFKELFASMGDELMSQRASDLADIRDRLLEILTGIKSASLQDLPYECILLTHDLTPSDTGQMNKSLVAGILTEVGGMTSHTAIISRAMEIPAVLGVDQAMSNVQSGDLIILNGSTGQVIVNPSEEELNEAKKQKAEWEEAKKGLAVYKDKPTVTKDGGRVELFANIGGKQDLDSVLRNGAEGIGLFRTEFLFMDRTSAPTEEEQFQVYKDVAEALDGKPVIIRTLDIGGDKDVPYLGLMKEENPFLGYRAIRLCLHDTDLFTVQLRALLRASAFGDIQIMIPMISGVEELRQSKKLIEDIKSQLDTEGITYNKEIKVGIMIETPAASLISDMLAKECDFFSIGTNDLTQYTLAVDRGNKKVAYLYSTFHPALMRSIANIIANGKKAGIMVGMCGEAAGDPLMIPFLLAAGLDEFSMTASSILPARKLISTLDQKELEKKLEEMLSLPTMEEVKEYLK